MSVGNIVRDEVLVRDNTPQLAKTNRTKFLFDTFYQDFFLPHVENGTVTLIGATTENPSFQVNSALLSRCKVIVLKKHTVQSIMNILQSAVQRAGGLITANFQEGVKLVAPKFFVKTMFLHFSSPFQHDLAKFLF